MTVGAAATIRCSLACQSPFGRLLQVSFSRGNVLTLHNLELNLAPLLGGAAALVHVRRAFARRLSITIPWTALTTQPIQVVLDTVELVLSAAPAQAPGPTPAPFASALDGGGGEHGLAAADEQAAAAASGGGGGGWFGSTLQSIALRAGLNMTGGWPARSHHNAESVVLVPACLASHDSSAMWRCASCPLTVSQ
jgi:hypothetical protein